MVYEGYFMAIYKFFSGASPTVFKLQIFPDFFLIYTLMSVCRCQVLEIKSGSNVNSTLLSQPISLGFWKALTPCASLKWDQGPKSI